MLEPSRGRTAIALAALALALLTAAPASAQTPSGSRLVPVWAYVNGEAPVKGGQVKVLGAKGPIRQTNGKRSKRTNAQGVALLQFERLPRRFVVEVRGGRAAGMRVRGSQHRAVARYHGTRVVEVNPLTTLVTRLRHQRPRLDDRRAVRAVKRYFHVPQWADLGQHLRDLGDEWFDARAYVRAVRRQGSIDRLNRSVARKILSGKAPRAKRARRAPTAVASQGKGWSQMSAGELLGAGFGYLGSNIAGVITQGGITAALGALLQVAQNEGLINVPPSELDLVRQQLDALGVQISRLDGRVENISKSVARGRASELLHMSDNVLASIDSAKKRLALLANLDLNRERELRRRYAAEIDQYIHDKLLDAPEILNRHLNPALSIGDNVIKATSRALATERFFDQRDSAEVRAVYDYFAMYQLQLAVLLTNYWNAHPNTYSLATIKASLADIQANVLTTQKASLKPAVPAGMFFDTRTPRFMWGTQNETATGLRVAEEELETRSNIAMGGFGNWQMPSGPDYRNLVDGWSGTTPRAWLQGQVEVPLRHDLLWAYDSLHVLNITFGARTGCYIQVFVFDLTTGSMEQHRSPNDPRFEYDWNCTRDKRSQSPPTKDFLRSKSGGLMLLRYLAPGESYWWD
jgi:hypothetical protein